MDFELDATQKRVVRLYNLNSDSYCDSMLLTGRIVAREFDKSGVLVTGLTVEDKDGVRWGIAVSSFRLNEASMVVRSGVVTGLQTLLKDGSVVTVGIQLCGAGGRVIYLDHVI